MIISCYDIETDGLSADCKLLSLALQRFNLDTLQFLGTGDIWYFDYPDLPEECEAYKINGLSPEFLREYGVKDHAVALSEIYSKMKNTVLLGHNINRFDTKRLYNHLARFGLDDMSVLTALDTIKIDKYFSTGKKLSDMIDGFGIDRDEISRMNSKSFGHFPKVMNSPHDASWDVTATIMVFAKALALAGQKGIKLDLQ